MLAVLAAMSWNGCFAAEGGAEDRRPNVVVIMTDDMGFSDLGCYGGEIRTPNLDRLAHEGLRFAEFYNAGRCCPTRASLLTGRYQHRVGMHRNGLDLSLDSLTMAEALRRAGYRTAMAGKWHLTALRPLPKRHQAWIDHQFQPERPWGNPETYPTARGFERFYGTIFGIVNFFDPWTLMEGDRAVPEVPDDYYATDATSDRAVAYIREMAAADAPLFLYVAYHAPHWPLHARPADIARYRGAYDGGWDALRAARYRRQLEMGLFDAATTPLPPIQGSGGAWNALPPEERRSLAKLMEVHAAMVDRVDQGIGRIVEALRDAGRLEDTLLFFLSDNGASPERYLKPGYDRPSQTRDGRPVVYQPHYDAPGSETTWPYLGPPWASAVNTPFRFWKAESYKGGVQTPLIVHWPAGLKTPPGAITRQRGHVIDVMPTVLEAAGVEYAAVARARGQGEAVSHATHRERETNVGRPRNGAIHGSETEGGQVRPVSGAAQSPLDGLSLMPIFRGEQRAGHRVLCFEHEGHKSVLRGPWKANQLRRERTWRLYRIDRDRTETLDLAAEHPEVLNELRELWLDWAEQMRIPPAARE